MTTLRVNWAGLLAAHGLPPIKSAHLTRQKGRPSRRDATQHDAGAEVLQPAASPDVMALVRDHNTHDLRVRDLMSTNVISVAPDTPVQEIAAIFAEHRISSGPVVSVPVVGSTGRLVGIISEGDLFRRVELGTEPRPTWWQSLFADPMAAARAYVRSHGGTARDVMTFAPITSVPDEPLRACSTRGAKASKARASGARW